MAHADRPTPPPSRVAPPPRVPRDARALVGLAARVTYPGGVLAYLTLTVVSRDIALMGAGAILVLYGAALGTALQRQGPSAAPKRRADGAP